MFSSSETPSTHQHESKSDAPPKEQDKWTTGLTEGKIGSTVYGFLDIKDIANYLCLNKTIHTFCTEKLKAQHEEYKEQTLPIKLQVEIKQETVAVHTKWGNRLIRPIGADAFDNKSYNTAVASLQAATAAQTLPPELETNVSTTLNRLLRSYKSNLFAGFMMSIGASLGYAAIYYFCNVENNTEDCTAGGAVGGIGGTVFTIVAGFNFYTACKAKSAINHLQKSQLSVNGLFANRAAYGATETKSEVDLEAGNAYQVLIDKEDLQKLCQNEKLWREDEKEKTITFFKFDSTVKLSEKRKMCALFNELFSSFQHAARANVSARTGLITIQNIENMLKLREMVGLDQPAAQPAPKIK